MSVFDLKTGNILQYSDGIINNPIGVETETRLTLNHVLSSNYVIQSTNNSLILSQAVVARKSIWTLSASSLLPFNDSSLSQIPKFLTAENLFFCWNEAANGKYPSASNSLMFGHAAGVYRNRLERHVFTIGHGVGLTIVRVLNPSNSITFNNYVSVFKPDKNFIAIGVPLINPPPLEKFKLIYNTRVIGLRSPDFNNSVKLEENRISRYSRGGDIVVFRDNMWPEKRIFHWSFSYLNREKIEEVKSLFKESLGKNITIVDHENNSWEGVILTPGAAGVETEKNNFTIDFEFQGVAV
jgi:hypothetical protein